MSDSLGLIMPPLKKVDTGAFDIHPKKVEAWVAALPMANVGETARLVYKALVDTNKTKYSYQYRTRFLEMLHAPIEHITTGMKKHFVGANFPLPEKNQKVATIAREVYTEMAMGYKIALQDMISSHRLFPDNRLLALLIHRAMSSLSRELLTSYQMYAPHRKEIWQEFHRIYSFARSKKLHRVGIMPASHKQPINTTISDEYKRILLLSLASPYCLRHGDANKIYTAVEQWSTMVELKEISYHDYKQAVFIVDLESDQPPRFLAGDPAEHKSSALSLVISEKLTQMLQQEIQQAEEAITTTLVGLDMQSNELSPDLLRKLLNYWGHIPKRAFPRTRKQEKISIAMGLNSAHRIISKMTNKHHKQNIIPDSSGQFVAPAKFASTSVVNLATPKQDVWDMVYPMHKASQSSTKVKSNAAIAAVNEESLNEHYRADQAWEIVNESAGGYCIRCLKDCAVKVQVGELISIQRHANGEMSKWGVAVICWMKFNNKRILTLGIQMITPAAKAAGIKITASRDNYQRTLLLPQLAIINQPATLITPPVPYRVGSKVVVRVRGKKIFVELTKQLVNTGLFAQFQYIPAKHPTANNSPAKNERNTGKQDREFNSVWSSI